MSDSSYYYWVSHRKKHSPGDIISPGNWGRGVMITPGHRWQKMEMQFEAIRLSVNPELPSRLASAFVFEDIKTAMVLLSKQPGGTIYKVKLVDKSMPSYRTDMAWVHPELEMYDAHIGNPKLYWSRKPGDELQWPEILTFSPLEIIESIG